MPRWTGTWLQGPEVTLGELRNPEGWQGRRLGLPREGRGAMATFSGRLAGFVIDIVASALLAGLVVAFLDNPTPVERQGAALVALALEQVVLVALTGQTLGMRAMGLTVVRLRVPERVPGIVPSAVRAFVLLATFGLSGFFTRDGRGVHDLLAGCAVVRS